MVRVSVNGEVVQFSSKLNIDPNAWDVARAKAAGTTMKAKQLNELLDNMRTSIKNHYYEIELHEAYVTAEKVKNAFLGNTIKQRTLLELFRKHNDDARKLLGISKSTATLEKYDRCCRRMEEFLASQYKVNDIALKEINHMFITDFENYLRGVSKCNENTTAKFIQTFKMIVIIAKNNGWIFADLFANYKIRLKKVDRGYLNDQEIQKIMNKTFASKRLEQVRDIFIFSCYSGLAYIDVKNLTKSNIITSFDGSLWISTKRQKTDTAVNVPLLKIPLSIIEKYEAERLPGGVLLPVLSNQKMNSYRAPVKVA